MKDALHLIFLISCYICLMKNENRMLVLSLIGLLLLAGLRVRPKDGATEELGRRGDDLANTFIGEDTEWPYDQSSLELNMQSRLENDDLLPDIYIYPPHDMQIVEEGSRTLLLFGVTYWNKGRGPFELISTDEYSTGDDTRTVFQRIYSDSGDFSDREVSTFFWHKAHGHYHFEDFVLYRMTLLDEPEEPKFEEKISYCVRDTKKVDPEIVGIPDEPVYTICGQERQGISVGWGDTYEYTFPGQDIDITNMASGRYKLENIFDPESRFSEVVKENNAASVVIDIDKERKNVEVVIP
jgi:hypothetical protein